MLRCLGCFASDPALAVGVGCEGESATGGGVVESRELEDWGAGATNPLDVVLSDVVEPLETVAADNQGEEVGDRVIVVGIGEDELELEDWIREGGVGCRNIRCVGLGCVEDE